MFSIGAAEGSRRTNNLIPLYKAKSCIRIRSRMMYLVILLVAPVAIMAFPPNFPPMLPPPPRELPPGFEAVLPAETVTKLKAIHENNSMPPHEKYEAIDKIMSALPDEILDKLPTPPGFDRLPQDTQDKLKAVHRDRTLDWKSRMNKIREVIESLPEEQRRLLPPPPPPGFDILPENAKEQLRVIHENKDLGHRERYMKIKAVIDALPEDIRSKLPPPPPGPPMLA